MTALLLALPLLLFAAGAVAALAGRGRVAAMLLAAGSLSSLLYAFCTLTGVVGAAAATAVVRLPPPYPPLRIVLAEGRVTAAFVAAMSISWLVASLVHRLYWGIEEGEPPRVYTALLGASMASMYVVALSRDFVSLLVGWELMSFTLACMIAYAGGEDARKTSLLYLILMHVVSLPMFVVVAASLAAGAAWYTSMPGWLAPYALIAFLLAFTAKSGLVPLHFWLPPAHSRAPSDASVVLSGASVKPSLLQALLLLVALSGAPTLAATRGAAVTVAGLAALSIAVGVAGALWSRQGKRVLAYSTIAYMGVAWLLAMLYMLCGWGALLLATLIVVAAHAAYKSAAFAAVGIAKAVWGSDAFSDPVGLCFEARYCRLAAAASASMMPIPPLAHFIGDFAALTVLASSGAPKLYTYLAAAAIALTAVGVGLAYTRVVALLQSAPEPPPRRLPAPCAAIAAAVIAAVTAPAAIIALLHLYPPVVAAAAVYAVVLAASLAGGAILSRRTPHATPWLSGEEAVYARRVSPASAPIAAPSPRHSIEAILFRLRRPQVHEVGYEGVYRRLARAFAATILRPLVAPLETGNLGLYIALILAYFVILVFVGGWLAP